MNYEIGFIGAGKMGGAILAAIADTVVPMGKILVCDSVQANRDRYAAQNFSVTEKPLDVVQNCKAIVVAVKPQDFDALLTMMASEISSKQLVISIAAGKTLATMRVLLGGGVHLVRVMPNLAAMVGEGMMVYAPDVKTTKEEIVFVETILKRCGAVVQLEETHFDAVTALSGSGPAFFAYVMKAMADGGKALGLPPSEAEKLALQTMLGTAKYLRETQQDVATFIKAVCSPKGTTEAGMRILESSDCGEIMADTLSAAARRSKELAQG